jgi:hypothetical protein
MFLAPLQFRQQQSRNITYVWNTIGYIKRDDDDNYNCCWIPETPKILYFDIQYTKPQKPIYLHVVYSAFKSEKWNVSYNLAL